MLSACLKFGGSIAMIQTSFDEKDVKIFMSHFKLFPYLNID